MIFSHICILYLALIYSYIQTCVLGFSPDFFLSSRTSYNSPSCITLLFSLVFCHSYRPIVSPATLLYASGSCTCATSNFRCSLSLFSYLVEYFFAFHFSRFLYVSHFFLPYRSALLSRFPSTHRFNCSYFHLIFSSQTRTLTPFCIIFLHPPKTVRQSSFERTIVKLINFSLARSLLFVATEVSSSFTNVFLIFFI